MKFCVLFIAFDSRTQLSRSAFQRLKRRCGTSVSGVLQNVHGFEPRYSVAKPENLLRIMKHVFKLPLRHVVLVIPTAFFCNPSFRYVCRFLHFFSVHPCLSPPPPILFMQIIRRHARREYIFVLKLFIPSILTL